MTVRHYAFSVRSNGQKIACGTTPGSSMEDAAREVNRMKRKKQDRLQRRESALHEIVEETESLLEIIKLREK
jgi:hypothetical protein